MGQTISLPTSIKHFVYKIILQREHYAYQIHFVIITVRNCLERNKLPLLVTIKLLNRLCLKICSIKLKIVLKCLKILYRINVVLKCYKNVFCLKMLPSSCDDDYNHSIITCTTTHGINKPVWL